MTTSPRLAHSCCSGGTQAGPRAPAWGPQLPPPPPPRLLPVPAPPRVSSPPSGPRPGSLPAAPPRADAEGEGAAMRPGAGDPLCEYRSRPLRLCLGVLSPRNLLWTLPPFTSENPGSPRNLLPPNHPSLGTLDPVSPRSYPTSKSRTPSHSSYIEVRSPTPAPSFLPTSSSGSFKFFSYHFRKFSLCSKLSSELGWVGFFFFNLSSLLLL